MYGIVHSAIHQVAQDKAREKHKCILPHEQVHQPKNYRSKDNAWYRGHKQSLPVSGVMVVITMQGIDEFFCPVTISNHVKKKPVSYVFKETPEKHTT